MENDIPYRQDRGRIRIAAAAVLFVLFATSGALFGQTAHRIEISPESVLLVGLGDQHNLEATVYDSNGGVITPVLSWQTSAPGVVTVDTSGLVAAVASLGSAAITASADGVTSDPTIVFVAGPAAGALLYTDNQVVAGPVILAPGSNGAIVGSRVQATLSGLAVPPAPDTAVLPIEDTPFAGRVVSATVVPEGVQLEIEITPLSDLFLDLNITVVRHHEADPISGTTFIFSDGFESGDTSAWFSSKSSTFSLPENGAGEPEGPTEFNLGPFECTADTSVNIETPELEYTLAPTFDSTFEVGISGGVLQHVLIRADVSVVATLDGDLKFPLNLEGKITCQLDLFSLNIPTGTAGIFVIIKLPIGLGFELAGSLEVDTLIVELAGGLVVDASVGFSYDAPGDIEPIGDFGHTGFFEPGLEIGGAGDARLDLSAFVYGTAGLEFAPTLLPSSTVKIADSKVGAKQSAALALPVGQAEDKDYASDYGFDFRWELEPGEDVSDLFKALGWNDTLSLLSVDGDVPISHSPQGTFEVDPDQVQAGETVTFTVDLEDVSYLDSYNVEAVRIYAFDEDESALTLLTEEIAANSQTVFTPDWTPAGTELGKYTVVAFVETELLPVLELEVADDSQRTLDVGTVIVGDVDVTMQAEVDALAGVIEITGSLLIGHSAIDPITTLQPLDTLEVVGGELQINALSVLTTLSGLDKLDSIGSNLRLTDNPTLTDIGALQGLSLVPGALEVVGNGLFTLTGLHNIAEVGSLRVGGSTLNTMAGPGLDALVTVNQGMTIEVDLFGSLASYELPLLERTGGLEVTAQSLGGSLTTVRLPALVEITESYGEINVSSPISTIDLPSLIAAQGGPVSIFVGGIIDSSITFTAPLASAVVSVGFNLEAVINISVGQIFRVDLSQNHDTSISISGSSSTTFFHAWDNHGMDVGLTAQAFVSQGSGSIIIEENTGSTFQLAADSADGLIISNCSSTTVNLTAPLVSDRVEFTYNQNTMLGGLNIGTIDGDLLVIYNVGFSNDDAQTWADGITINGDIGISNNTP